MTVRLSARRALRLARATRLCAEHPFERECQFLSDHDEDAKDRECMWIERGYGVVGRHVFEASALLDGLSVRAVTKAGG